VRRRARERDSGSAALELVILAPVLIALLGLTIAAGRTSIAQSAVQAAARDAARQASIALSPGQAQEAGTASALAALRQDGLACQPVVRVNTFQFTNPLGEPATVSATVQCTVPLADLWIPGLPGSRTMTATFYSPLDLYRQR
jgi:Flp pilus assembly protein TadG